jgi:serine phosphatase RsbU (regulator of sigma subunit)
MAPSDFRDEDDSERTMFRRPNTLMPITDPADELVHVLVLQPTGSSPPLRLFAGSMTIGRTEGADFILPGSDVSRRHCQIDLVGVEVIAGGEVLVTDLGSTNGTFVDGTRVAGTVALSPGARLSIGGHHMLYERRARRELDEAEALERELRRANQYVLAILPLPIREGPVRAEWYYVPCTGLGGDAFGYRDLGDGHFAGYIIDVVGHGVGAAMHSVTVANVLRQDGLPGVDFRDPAAVMTRLNDSFPMRQHDGLTFDAWYWVYNQANRMLTYCAAGSHPAWLADRASGNVVPLPSDNPAIGSIPEQRYAASRAFVPPGAALYLFSDGAFDIEDKAGTRWTIDDLVAILRAKPIDGVTEPQRVYNAVREAARRGPLDDDFSLIVLTFP